MIKIVGYKKIHQNGIDTMMNEIASEFEEEIFSKPTQNAPSTPNNIDNYWIALNNDNNTEKVVGTIGIIVVENDFGILKKMMVKKEFRGKELEASKKLLQTAIE